MLSSFSSDFERVIRQKSQQLPGFIDFRKRSLAIDISTKEGLRDEMIKKANGKRTIPQIFFDDQHIGGYDEVRALEKENKLQDLLKN